MDPGKRERRFLEAVRLSGLVPEAEIDRAVAFQKFAHARGKPLPLDRILLKFDLLDEAQIDRLYVALRYFLWRKEDKLYGKIAVKNQLLTEQDMKRCLKEQKRAFREKQELRRVNEIAFEKGLMTPKEDRALVAKLKQIKPNLTITPLQINGRNGPGRGGAPAQKGEEAEWRKNMHARELQELQRASGVREDPRKPSSPRDEQSEKTVKFEDGDLPELTATPEDLEPVHLSADQEDDDIGDPLSDAKGKPVATDDDLDPLWAEADLDDVELDSEQREAAKNKDLSSSADDDTDNLF